MATQSVRPLACLLVVLLAACSQSSDPAGTTLSGAEAEIGPTGGSVTLEDGVVVEAVAGTFAEPASFEFTPGTSAALPEGTTAVGEAVTLTASVEPSAPLIVGLPIPAGTTTDGLMMLHTDDGGEQQLLGGWVEDGTYFAASPRLSEFQLVHHSLEDALAAILIAGSGTPTALQGNLSGKDPDLGREWVNLARGSLERPAHRAVRVVGPREVAVGQTTSFVARDFDALAGHFVEYSWSVYGSGLSIVGPGPTGAVTAEAEAVGRSVLTVEARDPLTGATAFGSWLVFTVEESVLTIVALPLQSLCFEEADLPTVNVYFEGGTPPYRWSWAWEDGVASSGEGDTATAIHGPITTDITLTIRVVDAAGLEAETAIAVRGLPGYRSDATAVLAGPLTGEVGQKLDYRILSWDEEGSYTLPFQVLLSGAAGTAEVDGDVVRVTFAEPGWAFITLADSARAVDQARPWVAPVQVTGQAPPAEARLTAALPRATVNVPFTLQVEARGGVVASLDEEVEYRAEVDFGYGDVQVVAIPAATALDWAVAPVEYTWTEPGTYTVTLIITTPDGQTAEAAIDLEVLGEQRAVGAFEFAEIPGLEVLVNEVILVIDAGFVIFEKWQLSTRYQVMAFEIGAGGETVPVPTDCIQESQIRLRNSDLTVDPIDGSLGGTLTVRDLMDMTGSQCPFGGGSRDVVRRGEATGSFRNGVLELTLFFPTIPEAYETTLQIRAAVG